MAKKKTEPKVIIDKIVGKGYYRTETPESGKTETVKSEEPKREDFPTAFLEKATGGDTGYDPATFLKSKGIIQVHEGQRANLTFEEIHDLLRQYREL